MGKLEINSLTKVFSSGENQIMAVDDLDITIEDGEFIVLVGPSGCGKSTTLRCIAGLESVSEGEIVLDGRPVTDQKPKNRNMAMVFQNYALYPHMTARENMSFGLKMTTDLSKAEINERVEETAEMMGIENLLGDRPGELSGGQQQRVALGRAIVREPEVFLMDEPLSNLDAKLRTTMRTELQELQQIGTPLECYHRPVNRFVASFIGSPSMNFLETTLSGQTLEHEAFEYHLSTKTAQDLSAASTDTVTLGVRPEDIQPADADDRNGITVTVNVTEPLGDTTYVYFDIGDTPCTASIPSDLVVNEGDRLSILFPEDRIHLFDGASGEAIKNRDFVSGDETDWSVEA